MHSWRVTGRSSGDWILFGLIGLIVLLGVFAIGQGVTTQQRIARTFVGWYEGYSGYQKAMADQAKNGQPALVYFYAPWCPHCKRFTAEILSKPEVQAYVKRYPHVRINPENGQLEKQIMEQYGAVGFPTFYVTKKDGTRTRVETHSRGKGGEPHLKSPSEFIRDVEKAAH